MSRFKIGDVLVRAAGSGFCAAGPSLVVIPDAEENREPLAPCMLDCGDPDCVEWPTLWGTGGGDGDGEMFCHVSECQLRRSDAGGA